MRWFILVLLILSGCDGEHCEDSIKIVDAFASPSVTCRAGSKLEVLDKDKGLVVCRCPDTPKDAGSE